MAQRGVNKVIILGRLGKDPEVRYLNGGSAVCSFSVATSESWNDRNTGEKKEQTEWHNIVTFGKLAEIAGEYLAKGSVVYLEGQIKTRKWKDQSGNDRYTTEINIPQMGGVMQIIQGKPSGGGSQQQQQQQQQPQQRAQSKPNGNGKANANTNTMNFEDDIPF